MKTKHYLPFASGVLLLLLVLNGILFYSTKCAGEYLQSENVWGISESVRVENYIRQQEIIRNLPEDPEKTLVALDAILHYLEETERKAKVESGEWGPWRLVKVDEEEEKANYLRIPNSIIRMGLHTEDMENYKRIRSVTENVLGYEDYIRNIGTNARNIAEALYPIYRDEVMLRRVAHCEQDYYGMEYLKLTLALDDTINMFLSYHVTDLLAFLFCFLLALAACYAVKANSFEESGDVWRTFAGTAGIMVVGTAAFYLSDFWMVAKLIGIPELDIPLQSLGDFYSCPYTITISGFLIFCIGIKLLTLFLLLLLCMLAFTNRRRILACTLVTAGIGLEFFLNLRMPETEVGIFFREINLFSGFTPERFFNRYFLLNVGGRMVPRLVPFLVLLSAAFLLTAFLMVRRLRQWHISSRQEAMNAYFGEIDKRYQETRMLWHDFNNHLLAIKALYENGHGEQAAKYIDDLSEQSHERLLPVKTGSNTVDLILFKKHEQAMERGIRIKFRIGCSLSGIAVTDYDLCSLFGNILDNAIEAADKLQKHDKEISLRVERQNSMLFLSCENPYEGELLPNDGTLKTTKKDTARHGIGLNSIRQISKKYKGNMEIETEDQVFRLSVLLNA